MRKSDSLSQAFTELAGQGSDKRKDLIPEAWRPRMEVDSDGGFVVAPAMPQGNLPDAESILRDFGLNPDEWTVVNARKSRWQRYDEEWLESVRLNLQPTTKVNKANDADIDKLISDVTKWRPPKGTKVLTGPLAALYATGDQQFGKDSGDGTDGTIRRVLSGIDEMCYDLDELRRLKRPIGEIGLLKLGDTVEGCTSQRGKVMGGWDYNLTEQLRIARRLYMAEIKAAVMKAERITVGGVDGNHGHTQRQMMTAAIDNFDIDAIVACQEACAENPTLEHVQFRYPNEDCHNLTIDFAGCMVGLTHGYVEGKDLPKWWASQSAGRTSIGGADILITGHLHHFVVKQVGPRLWIQVPAMDGGSPWFRDAQGLESPSGLVRLIVGDDYDPRKSMSVLAGENRSA